jgi:hypothetical protein
MNNINFYEVISGKSNKWMGSYSKQFDFQINVGASALAMAQMNAKRNEGKIYAVDFDGNRELVSPK